MSAETSSRINLLLRAAGRGLSFVIIMPLLFRLISGTWKYWQGWVFLGLVFVPMMWVLPFFYKHDPSLPEQRMRYKEQIKEQASISVLAGSVVKAAILLPGLDIRYGWSHVPVWLVISSEAMVLLGFLIFVQVMCAKACLAGEVEVTSEQRVVSDGLYVVIRHPMYAGVVQKSIFYSIALGSYWPVILCTCRSGHC